jgi:PST family polysaccharide transporter
MLLPVSQVTYTVGRVMFPALAAVREDLDRLRRGYRRAARIVSFLTAPSLIGLAAVAPTLIPLLWGPAWEPSVPLLQILCLSGVPQCLIGTTEWLFQAIGKTTAFFRVGVVGAVVTLAAFAIGLQWGVTGVATAWLVRSWLLLPYTMRVASNLIGLRGRTVIADSTSSWVAAGLMGACVYGLAQWSVLQTLGDGILVLQVVCGAVLYLGFVHLIDRDLPRDVLRLVRQQA